jgi:hypothetical protein
MTPEFTRYNTNIGVLATEAFENLVGKAKKLASI